jgi:hypothetical protein
MVSQLIECIGQICCSSQITGPLTLQALTTNHRLHFEVKDRSFMKSTLAVILSLTTRDYVKHFLSEKQVLAFSFYPALNMLFEMFLLCVLFYLYMALFMQDILTAFLP